MRARMTMATTFKEKVRSSSTSTVLKRIGRVRSMLGELIEYDTTNKIFTNPGIKQTEDYVTGRFG